jgi:hypothetical protein
VWQWIDSCCIDKSSSAELSEAINSMFQWYENSQICYTYLNDVAVGEEDHERENSAFRNSKWFTRGWTLQELLAPQTVVFFNHGWFEIGTRTSLGPQISAITNIGENHLNKGLQLPSTAQKFSWASRRHTLRIEDTAYCLMGLFGVNMPLLYGEGSKAFMRLQLEIIKVSDDDSIFAWSHESPRDLNAGLLANSPSAFHNSGNISTPNWSRCRLSSSYLMTNQGLEISLMLITAAQAAKKDERDQYFALLSCYTLSKPLGKETADEVSYVMLRLGTYTALNERKCYRRWWDNKLHLLLSTDIPRKGNMKLILVPQTPERKMAPRREISKLAISANHHLSNEFAISWIADFTGVVPIPSNQCPRIQKWLPFNSNAHERTLVINSGISSNRCRALVEFKSMSSPVEVQDAFILQIYRQAYDLQPVGLILLLPNGNSLDEVFYQDHALNQNPPPDWATITLPSGLVITAALRTRLRNGELVYAVDVNTKPSSSLGGVQG